MAGALAAVAGLGERVWRHHGRLGRIELSLDEREVKRKEEREDLKEYMERMDRNQGKMLDEMKKHGECLAVICDRLEIGG
jgi:hypothetical protein